MPRADVIEMSCCQSTEMGRRVQAALLNWRVESNATRDQIEMQEAIAYDRVKAAEEATSWAKPNSAAGALVHLLLAASDIEDLPRMNPEYLERAERTVCRNLYAVRDFLLRQMSAADRAALQELMRYMGRDVSAVNPLLASDDTMDRRTASDIADDQFNVA